MSAPVERFCPKCGARGRSAFCPEDGTEMRPLAAKASTPPPSPPAPAAPPPPAAAPAPGWNTASAGGAPWREVQPPPPTRGGTWGWIVAVVAIVVVVALIGAAMALSSQNTAQPGTNPTPTPTLPNCSSTQDCLYPSSVVLLSSAAGMCNGSGGTNQCPSMSGGGFGCEIPNDYTLGCHLTYNYTSFHITWSATGPLGIGVGSNGMDCKWLDAGGCTGTAASSGDRWITATWGFDGAIWFDVMNLGSSTVTINSMTITAYHA